MNGFRVSGKARDYERPVPGCLGRMVNLFDLTSGVAGQKRLTEKPHGSPLSRSRSDVSKMSSAVGDEVEDKEIISDLRASPSGKISSRTPVKMLIAQEMSKDLESKHNPPNLVAKLMGLDGLPQHQPDLGTQRNHSKCYLQNCHSEVPKRYWEQDNNCEVLECEKLNEYKDIYESWHQPQGTNCRIEKSPQKGRHNENANDKRMALVRQKFMEAKRLSTDEKLRQTKEFQDALEVLSSNGDLFLKFLQEPDSLFSHLYGGQSVPSTPETKRITVLRPSKMVANDKYDVSARKCEKQIKKLAQVDPINGQDNQRGYSSPISAWKSNDSPAQPTRIVVLKPSPGKIHEVKAVVSSTPSSPQIRHGESFFDNPGDDEAREAWEMAKEITQQMRENLAGHRRDETLLSSVLSNGYTGDESSFHKSEAEIGNLSDTEIMSPISRHSWDYINKYGSPYSSSFSRASCSPESSVCREAKKRLSERWAMMASNGYRQEQRPIWRSSSTLGEMLSLSEVKRPEIHEDENRNNDQNPRVSTSCLNSNAGGEGLDGSPRSLVRSKSVPVSSSVYGERLNVGVSEPEVCKPSSPKETTKSSASASKTSFKGKVTSLFFGKKSSKDRSGTSQFKEESRSTTVKTPVPHLPPEGSNDELKCRNNNISEEGPSPSSLSPRSTRMQDANNEGHGQGGCSQQEGFSLSKPSTTGILGENQDQPSPISVLEPQFEEHDITLGCFSSIRLNQHGKQAPHSLSGSNLIDKSPPIGSIARTLSWEEHSIEISASYPLNSSFLSEEEEPEWLFLIQSLLSAAGLDDITHPGSTLARWHSPDSPLDPLLRDKYLDLTAKDPPLHEAKRRHLRSNGKLVFDCVNAALLDLSGPRMSVLETGSGSLAERVWARVKEWVPGETECGLGGDSNSLVEEVVRKELLVGKGWLEQMRVEVENIGEEIEGKLLEEIVEESVIEWTGKQC